MENTSVQNPLQIEALVKGPGAVEAALVIAGFFVYEAGEPELIGGAKQLNDGLNNYVMKLRSEYTFTGKEGETYLFKTPENTIPAKNVMLIGLGDKADFSLTVIVTVGRVALRKTMASGFTDIAFAPEVRDAGVTTFTALQVAQTFTEAVMDEYQKMLSEGEKLVPITSFKILAGAAHEADAIQGINQALAKFQTT